MSHLRPIIIAFGLLLAVICLPEYAAESAQVSARAGIRSSTSQVGTVRAQIKEILAAPEYNRMYNQGLPKWMPAWLKTIIRQIGNGIKAVLNWLGDALGTFLKWLRKSLTFSGADTAGKIASFVFACIVIITFIALVTLITRKLLQAGFKRVKIEDQLDGFAYELPSAKPMISEAARLAETGDYRAAFRCAYLACISYLDEIEALRFERSRTNWEYLRELKDGGKDAPYDELKPLTLDFDRMFYGNSKCDQQDYLRALDAYNRITGEAAA